MSLDRFVYFKKEVPTKDQIGEVLEDYLSDIASSITWNQDRWLVMLPGASRGMFERQGMARRGRVWNPERWIEVWIKDSTMDVITRMQDDVTNAIAAEFAVRCANFWEGELDQ